MPNLIVWSQITFCVCSSLLLVSGQAHLQHAKPILERGLPRAAPRSLAEKILAPQTTQSTDKTGFTSKSIPKDSDDYCNFALKELVGTVAKPSEEAKKFSQSYECINNGFLGAGAFGAVFKVRKLPPTKTGADSTAQLKKHKSSPEIKPSLEKSKTGSTSEPSKKVVIDTKSPSMTDLKVLVASRPTDIFAMKILDAVDDYDLKKIDREFSVMQKLNTENFIRFEEKVVIGDKVLAVMEAAEGGEFFDLFLEIYPLLNRSDPKLLLFYFKQMVKGLKDMHALKIVWRDLKMENMVVSGHLVKLIDMDSVIKRGTVTKSLPGTFGYMDPSAVIEGLEPDHEVFKKNPLDTRKIKKEKYAWDYYTDIYSLGTVLAALCLGNLPFRPPEKWKGSPIEAIMAAKLNGSFIIPKGTHVALAYLLSQMLLLNVSHRPQAWEVLYVIHTLGLQKDLVLTKSYKVSNLSPQIKIIVDAKLARRELDKIYSPSTNLAWVDFEGKDPQLPLRTIEEILKFENRLPESSQSDEEALRRKKRVIAHVRPDDVKIHDLGVANIDMESIKAEFFKSSKSKRKLLIEHADADDVFANQERRKTRFLMVLSSASLLIFLVFMWLYLRKALQKDLDGKAQLVGAAAAGSGELEVNQGVKVSQS